PYPLELAIRKMRARWGTCMPQKRKIILNATLSRFSPVCLEFVIVHELGHIFNPNHGPQFYAWLDRWLPDWRDRAARLSGGS
ncbi:MAG: M48 family metallopeptidase, partial [Desulfovibrio sp.]|nr:M48 family metallopeptidase [Desulfovibrio sp.]